MSAPVPTPFPPLPGGCPQRLPAPRDPGCQTLEGTLTYISVLEGELTEADQDQCFAGLESYIARGCRYLFIDAQDVVSGVGDLGARLCRWGVANLDDFDEIHVLTPTIATHNRLAIASLIMGPWLQAHAERPQFLAALRLACSRVAARGYSSVDGGASVTRVF